MPAAAEIPRPPPTPPATGPAPACRATRHTRLSAAAIAGACLAVLALASWLTPAAAGHGTHSQLGLPPCGWAMTLDRPCPSCGMTTAFAHAADGRFAQAAWTQPAGLLLAILLGAAFWGAGEVALLGSNLSPIAAKLLSTRWLVAGAAILGAAWIFKMATWTGAA